MTSNVKYHDGKKTKNDFFNKCEKSRTTEYISIIYNYNISIFRIILCGINPSVQNIFTKNYQSNHQFD